LHRYQPTFQMQTITISKKIKVWADSSLRHYKTFAYGEMALARREASTAGYQDALLLSSAGGLCCATSANLLVQRQGRWVTPNLASGCLPGTMRAEALKQGRAIESRLGDALIPGEAAVLLNSLDCRPITPEAAQLAEPLFRNILKESVIKG
jgi:branched-subunit amino acid aminotransferase/4-amino-4-deoxychorismate lyase